MSKPRNFEYDHFDQRSGTFKLDSWGRHFAARKEPAMTHYIPIYTQRGAGSREMALCGVFIEPTQHAKAPTCPTCAQALVDDDRYFEMEQASREFEAVRDSNDPRR